MADRCAGAATESSHVLHKLQAGGGADTGPGMGF